MNSLLEQLAERLGKTPAEVASMTWEELNAALAVLEATQDLIRERRP